MTEKDIAALRLQNQLLLEHKFTDVKAIVSHFGAIQAQDFAMSKWAVGVRLPNSNDELVEKALDSGEIVRTHVLRPTWHLAAADDITWMLELSAPNIRRQMTSYNKTLELDSKTFSKSNSVIARSLENNNHLTREELMQILQQHGIHTAGARSAHLMFEAELSGIVCNGIRKGKQQTYSLLSEKVKEPKKFSPEEALSELAKRYFGSHGPATAKDFQWWSGLSVKDVRTAINLNADFFVWEVRGIAYYQLKDAVPLPGASCHFLPAFDEFLISYKDRSASIHADFSPRAFTRNGIFKPLILLSGEVIGIWKKVATQSKVVIAPEFFRTVTKKEKLMIDEAAEKYCQFLGLKLELAPTSQIIT